MCDVIPFERCRARPDDGSRIYLLREHLVGVKDAIENRLMNTILCKDTVLIKMAGLAGLCHDIAKAHVSWQSYIKGERKRGPNHAPEGAYFFSYLGYHLLQKEGKWAELAVNWLWLTRDIADHHGRLKNLSENYWIGAGEWNKVDLYGISQFIYTYYPELKSVAISVDALSEWVEEIFEIFEDATDLLDLGYTFPAYKNLIDKICGWRELTTALTAGDRFQIKPINMTKFISKDHERNNKNIDDYCKKTGINLCPK